jgi:hypothetical protein
VRTLGAIVEQTRGDEVVRKGELSAGDRVIVSTRNSIYSLWALGGDSFAVSGGWFDKTDEAPTVVTINGCTYGGSVIRHDVVAARGLFLEFGNNVSTTRIQSVRVLRGLLAQDQQAALLPC